MRFLPALLVAFIVTCTLAHAQDLSGVDFRLQDINGKEQSFQQFLKTVRGDGTRKGAIMISFWALWCEPCKQEMKAMRGTFDKLKDRNFHYIAINTDNIRSVAKVKAYVSAQNLPFQFWLDSNSEVFKKLNGQSMPFSLILNEQGKVVAKRVGYLAGEEKDIEADILKTLE